MTTFATVLHLHLNQFSIFNLTKGTFYWIYREVSTCPWYLHTTGKYWVSFVGCKV
jgi:hypothetical protein